MIMFACKALFVLLVSLFDVPHVDGGRKRPPYTEEERRAQYIQRGYSWPITEYSPNTEGWKGLMERRLAQIMALHDMQQKWDGWTQTMTAAVTQPNYTEFGWGLTQAPQSLTRDIRQAIYDGLPDAREEGNIDVIDGPIPLFIEREDLTQRALHELQPILEAWAGFELVPSIAYGFRLYRNESRLWMHVDRTQTHVISCIYHIASSDNSKPWPISIEDYDGHTNSVILKPGDILLYESAKNFHGRPTKFNGDWYTSLFVHFYPKDPEWSGKNHDLDSHYAVPPDWGKIVDSEHPHLVLYGTSMMEPDCPDSWCLLTDAKQWEGPGEYGKVLTGRGKKYDLDIGPPKEFDKDKHIDSDPGDDDYDDDDDDDDFENDNIDDDDRVDSGLEKEDDLEKGEL